MVQCLTTYHNNFKIPIECPAKFTKGSGNVCLLHVYYVIRLSSQQLLTRQQYFVPPRGHMPTIYITPSECHKLVTTHEHLKRVVEKSLNFDIERSGIHIYDLIPISPPHHHQVISSTPRGQGHYIAPPECHINTIMVLRCIAPQCGYCYFIQ